VDAARRPCFLITIDTEGDDLWGAPRTITTRNSRFLARFQALCEEYGQRPTWLTDYEMAICPDFQRFGRDVLARGAGEIGMHLHAWNTPPLEPLTADDYACAPYLVEYPDRMIREKVRTMTALLEDTFGRKMLSHRAGRWAFDERYAAVLVEEGYQVDCSVTPGVSWRTTPGNPAGQGGTDYTRFPSGAYWMDPTDISRPGDSPLLQLPVTIVSLETPLGRRARAVLERVPGALRPVTRVPRAVLNRTQPRAAWLRPTGRNRAMMLRVVDQVLAEGRDYAEFMLHSSEFMPGGSPTFRTEASIEQLYADLRALFEHVKGRFVGATLTEYLEQRAPAHPAGAARAAALPARA
jgi:hypothetical protein